MPLKEFTDGAVNGLMKGEEQIAVGMAGIWFDRVETPRQEGFVMLNGLSNK